MTTRNTGTQRDAHCRHLRTWVIALLIAVVATTITLGARMWMTASSHAAGMEGSNTQTANQQLPPDVAFTTLTSSGFAPTVVMHAAGQFKLVVQNKSGIEPPALRFNGETDGNAWRNVRTLGQVHGWTREVDLDAGTYTLTEANHPEWVCQVRVQ